MEQRGGGNTDESAAITAATSTRSSDPTCLAFGPLRLSFVRSLFRFLFFFLYQSVVLFRNSILESREGEAVFLQSIFRNSTSVKIGWWKKKNIKRKIQSRRTVAIAGLLLLRPCSFSARVDVFTSRMTSLGVFFRHARVGDSSTAKVKRAGTF